MSRFCGDGAAISCRQPSGKTAANKILPVSHARCEAGPSAERLHCGFNAIQEWNR